MVIWSVSILTVFIVSLLVLFQLRKHAKRGIYIVKPKDKESILPMNILKSNEKHKFSLEQEE